MQVPPVFVHMCKKFAHMDKVHVSHQWNSIHMANQFCRKLQSRVMIMKEKKISTLPFLVQYLQENHSECLRSGSFKVDKKFMFRVRTHDRHLSRAHPGQGQMFLWLWSFHFWEIFIDFLVALANQWAPILLFKTTEIGTAFSLWFLPH